MMNIEQYNFYHEGKRYKFFEMKGFKQVYVAIENDTFIRIEKLPLSEEAVKDFVEKVKNGKLRFHLPVFEK